jgi:N-acetylglucosaminyl-diphospho-decaprenol L-rhamnosyltransferase
VDRIGHIVICLVAFRNAEDVLQCLGSLASQSYPDFEVVVCENGGPEAFAALCAVLPDQLKSGQTVTAIADHSNPGYAGGINRCMAERPGQAAYWVLNPDTVPQPVALGAMAAVLASGLGDAVGGPIVLPTGNLRTCGGKWQPWIAYSSAIANGVPLANCPDTEDVERSLSFISGASILVSQHFIEVAGQMREDYFLYGEEVEWCLRASAKGLRLRFCKDAVVLHYQGTTTGSADDIGQQGRLPIFCDERNRILTLRDAAPWATFAIGLVGALLLIFWRYGRRLAGRSMWNALAGWWAGLCNRRGKPAWLAGVSTKA